MRSYFSFPFCRVFYSTSLCWVYNTPCRHPHCRRYTNCTVKITILGFSGRNKSTAATKFKKYGIKNHKLKEMKENYFFVFQKREREKRAIQWKRGTHGMQPFLKKKKKEKKKTPTSTSYSKEQYNKCVYKNESMRDRKFQVLTFQL